MDKIRVRIFQDPEQSDEFIVHPGTIIVSPGEKIEFKSIGFDTDLKFGNDVVEEVKTKQRINIKLTQGDKVNVAVLSHNYGPVQMYEAIRANDKKKGKGNSAPKMIWD